MTCTFLWNILVVIPLAFAKGLNNLVIRASLTALLFAPAFASAATYYIAPGGSDSNPGTESAPFLTLQKARDAVRAAISGGMMTSDLTVYLGGGTYLLNSTLTFGSSDSGRNGYNVVWTSYPGENAVISGGQQITGWSLYDSSKNIYRVSVGTGWKFRQLYVNGTHARRARGPLNPTGWSRTSTGFTAPNSSMASWGNQTNIEFVMNGNWMMNRCKVASISGTNVTIAQPCFDNFKAFAIRWGANLPSWIENAYELLDAPGEWYLNTATGYVYYIPRSGEDMSTAEVIAPKLQDMISATGLTNVVFNRLSFEHTTWLAPDLNGDGYVNNQAGYHWTGTSRANYLPMHSPAKFTSSNHITFQNDLFSHLGSRALFFDQGSQDINLSATQFIDNAAGAIQIGGTRDASNTNPATQTQRVTIRDNFITDGFEYMDTGAAFVAYAANVVLDHNEVDGANWIPISVGWGWDHTPSYARNNQVTWNFTHEYCKQFRDCAALYTLGNQQNMALNNNYMLAGGIGYGCVYPDQGSSFEIWTNNVCRQVPDTWLHIWTASIHDNTVTGNWLDTSRMLNNGTNNTVANNTVITNNVWPTGAQTVMSRAGISAGVTPGPGDSGPPNTVTASLLASPASNTPGQSSTLTWGSTNATSCAATNFSTGNATSGSVMVTPTVTTNYSVGCTGAGGTASASARVTVTTATSTTLEVRVNAGTDDAEEQKSTGTMYLNSSDLELTEDPEVWGSTAPTQVVGMRFNNITVPKGSTITNAYIQFTAKETTWTNSTSLVFRGQSADNAATFTSSASNVSSRPLTTAPVSWSPVVWTVANEARTSEKTPNLSSVIQEIVNRSGWSSGNSLAVVVNGSGHRTPWSYEGKSTAAPLLHIEYTRTIQ